jgi:hypothetical protein
MGAEMNEKIWQPGELEDYLCALHARLQAAVSTGSAAAPVNLSAAEITVLLQVIECFVSDD